MNDKDIVVRGTIERIFYAEHGRIVARTHVQKSHELKRNNRPIRLLSILGSLAEPTLGQEYEFTGDLSFNDQYQNWQLQFHTYRTILPTDADSILRYLVDVARWAGPVVSAQLVKAFGADTLKVIKENPARVADKIDNITLTRAMEMQSTLLQNEALEAAMIEIGNLIGGILPPHVTRKAIKKWGSGAAETIRANPFVLTKLHGVGFLSADAIHSRMGGDKNSLNRHKSAVVHTLTESAAQDGHTVLPRFQVGAAATKLVGQLRSDAIQSCANSGQIQLGDTTVHLTSLSEAENYVGGKLASMTENGKNMAYAFSVPLDTLTKDQKVAVTQLSLANVYILTGAPGTGKTYTVGRIVKYAKAAGLTVALAAPTGKGAKQIELALADLCPMPATTIHSLLCPMMDEETGEFTFERDENNPIDADLLVVDEFSMVGINLAHSLLRAVRPTTKLLIVGDHYQLPSVGPGAVLRDLLRAGVASHELTEIQRNAGTIVRLCHAIKAGSLIDPPDRLDLAAGENWRHIPAETPFHVKQVIEALIRDKLPTMGLDNLWDVQIISPTNEIGELSCQTLNALAKSLLNPAPPPDQKLTFAPGDKVVRTKNGVVQGADPAEDSPFGDPGFNEKVRIVNGDIGTVGTIDKKHVRVEFRFPTRRVKIKRGDHNLKLAYCLTCHKMQGSEIPVVILPLHSSYARMPMVNREWIYTAISRAKKFVVTVGDIDVLKPIVKKVGARQRQTALASRVRLQESCV